MGERRFEQCGECGHNHYDTWMGTYFGCLLLSECDCPNQPVVVEDGEAFVYPVMEEGQGQ